MSKRMKPLKNRFKFRIADSAFVYLRVSTDEQARDAYGLDSQLSKCRELCKDRGWSVLEIFRDAGVSGWADVERPEFLRMMRAIEEVRNVNLVFYDYSRFGRDTLKALLAFKRLDHMGLYSVAATNPTIDCATAAGRTARREALNKAEDFSDQHSENQQARMKAALDSGRWIGLAQLGFENVRTRIKGEPNIRPVEPAASLMRQSLELMATGTYRPATLLREMTALGLRSKKGNKLTINTFVRSLKNPAYIGKIPSKKYGPQNGLHQALVSEVTFRNVQLILRGKKPISAPIQRNRPELPLRHFLRCAHCNSPLTGGPSRSHTGRLYFYYHCIECHGVKCVPVAKAEEQFVAFLARLRPDASFSDEFTDMLRKEWAKTTADSTVMVENLQCELSAVRASDQKLLLKYLNDDPVIMPVFSEMKRKFEGQIAALEAQIAEAETARATFADLLAFSQTMLVDIPTAW